MPEPRMYSLFIKVNGKRVRIDHNSYSKAEAVRIYQSRLLGLLRFHAELRPLGKQVAHYCIFPAYNRDYKTAEEAMKDWNDGKDFSMTAHGGPYTSIRDCIPVVICFNKFTEVTLP